MLSIESKITIVGLDGNGEKREGLVNKNEIAFRNNDRSLGAGVPGKALETLVITPGNG